MRSFLITIALLISFSDAAFGAALAQHDESSFRWNAISGGAGFLTSGVGSPESDEGAVVLIDSMSGGGGPFGGVIGTIDVARYRGRELEVTASIEILNGNGTAAIWARADVEGRQSVFATSANEPTGKSSAGRPTIRLFVPEESSGLLLGAIVQGVAKARIADFKVTLMPSVDPKVTAFEVFETALNFMEAKALYAAKIDFMAVRGLALTEDLRNAPPAVAYPRIRSALAQLSDRHSFLISPSEALRRRTTGRATGRIEHQIVKDIGYISIPGFVGTGPEASNKFADEVCNRLSQLATDVSIGWVVDLRNNRGGNMWPMLRGLKALLGIGHYGSFRDRDGNDDPWDLRLVNGCELDVKHDLPVAVLVGPKTASSGEAVAIAFSGRPGSRMFGSRTAGLSTSNVALSLPDGSALFLTNAIDVDRTGKEFPNGLEPDVVVEQVGDSDPTKSAALEWLRHHERSSGEEAGN